MSIIAIPNTFSAGAVIVASQHNANFSTIYSDYNGNIDNNNIVASAGIVYSKLTLTGGIVNADINASAAIVGSKLNLTSPGIIGSVTPSTGAFTTLKVGTTNQGDILYDNGTSLVRLTPGTSGQFLKTLGTSANPVWDTVPSLSNVLFQLNANVSNQGTSLGRVRGTTLVPNAQAGQYDFIQGVSHTAGDLTTVWATKWIKIPGISTITVYAQIWIQTASGSPAVTIKVDVGGANSSVTGTTGQLTPEWKSLSIDVSGLSNGTTYDVSVIMSGNVNAIQYYLGNLISFGS
jgi:hypothetical protein